MTSIPDHAALVRTLLRHDTTAFVERCFAELNPATDYRDNWHIRAITYQLERVMSGECRRLIINVPPRSMKSITVSVAFTALVLGRDPSKRIMAVSYASKLAQQLGDNTRAILQAPWFREAFPACQLASVRADEITTTQHGYRIAGSIGGSLLGRGANIIVIDDPIKGLDAALSAAERRRVTEFYDTTLYTRLDDKQEGAIVIVMQRLHPDDLVGHVMKKERWEVLSIPAITVEETTYRLGPGQRDIRVQGPGDVLHPNREPTEILESLRRSMGSLNFSAQYQQEPLPAAGNTIQRDWLRYYDERPATFDIKICSWDTASTAGETSDWSVGTVWGAIGQDYYLIDVLRGHWEVPDLRRHILSLANEHRADATLIEDTELGRALAQDLRRTGQLCPILQGARFDKHARLLAQSARFEAGQVHLPREAHWLASYLNELLAFPVGKNDDQVDTTSQALRYLTLRTPVERQRSQGRVRPQGRPRRPATGP